jgi:FlaA1/EpsC-like NDP-sugar epimerase
MNVMDIARAVNPDAELKFIGIKPGEKLHEQMISLEDAGSTVSCDGYYKILPYWLAGAPLETGEVPVSADFVYNSKENQDWLEVSDLSSWITENMKNN